MQKTSMSEETIKDAIKQRVNELGIRKNIHRGDVQSNYFISGGHKYKVGIPGGGVCKSFLFIYRSQYL